MTITFIRHAEPNYSFINKDDNCQWANLAPLSECGVEQAIALASYDELKNRVIISSPYTRALQTASILNTSQQNGNNIIVEPLLHEWLPSKSFSLKAREVVTANKKFKKNEDGDYETIEEMVGRMNQVLDKYEKYGDIIIVSHSRFITTYLNSIGVDKKYLDYAAFQTIKRP
jgi:broad specificity phosphatase PhoE